MPGEKPGGAKRTLRRRRGLAPAVPGPSGLQEVSDMKVRPSVKPMCEKCKIIKRKGKVMVICENPKHKQRQG